jgi:cytochrome c5
MTLRTLAGLVLLTGSLGAYADAGKRGNEVYCEVCAACHGLKVPTAPQLGDRPAWTTLIKEGQVVLTADGWVGVRAMPARGGRSRIAQREKAKK